MRFTKVVLEFYPEANYLEDPVADPIELPVRGLRPSDPYILRGIDGLGPTESTQFWNTGYGDTRWPSGSNRVPRQLVMTIGLNPQYGESQTVEGLRQTLMKSISNSGKSVVVRFYNGDEFLCMTIALYTKGDTNIFAKDPGIQLTLDCTSPWFSNDEIKFFYPIDSSTGSFYTPVITGALPYNNLGSEACGFYAMFTLKSNANGLYIRSGGKTLEIDYDFSVNDFVIMQAMDNTTYDIMVIGGSGVVNLLSYIDIDSEWPLLFSGEGTINVEAISPLAPLNGTEWSSGGFLELYGGL